MLSSKGKVEVLLNIFALPKGKFYFSDFKLKKLLCYKSHQGKFVQGGILVLSGTT